MYISPKKFTTSLGFTLVELVITMLISSFITGAIYSAYVAQQRTQTAQGQVVEMQQNLRAAINFISSEVRMAGFDPQQITSAIKPGIDTATTGRFKFKLDKNENGTITATAADPDEEIEYGFSIANDTTSDGIADSGSASLGRQVQNAGGFQPIADDIVAVEFLYILADTSDNGIYDPPSRLAPTAAEIDVIRAMTISILARSANPDPNFNNTSSYTTASGAIWGPYADKYRRRLLTTTVQLRNMGL